MKIVLSVLFLLTVSLFAAGGLTRSLVPSSIELSNAPQDIKANYTVTDLLLVEDTATKIIASPFLIWTEAGLLAYEILTAPMIESQVNLVKKAVAAKIIYKVISNEKINKDEIEFLTTTYSIDSNKIPYAPFVYNFASGYAITKSASGRILEKISVKKVDIAHMEGFNVFMLFPIDNQVLKINGIIMPPLVFVEYGALLSVYTLDLANGSVKFYDPQILRANGSPTCTQKSSEPCQLLAYKVPSILKSKRNLLLETFANYLSGKYQ